MADGPFSISNQLAGWQEQGLHGNEKSPKRPLLQGVGSLAHDNHLGFATLSYDSPNPLLSRTKVMYDG